MLGAHAAEANALGCRLKVVGFNPVKIMCVKEKYVMLATCAAKASVFKCRLTVVVRMQVDSCKFQSHQNHA